MDIRWCKLCACVNAFTHACKDNHPTARLQPKAKASQPANRPTACATTEIVQVGHHLVFELLHNYLCGTTFEDGVIASIANGLKLLVLVQLH